MKEICEKDGQAISFDILLKQVFKKEYNEYMKCKQLAENGYRDMFPIYKGN